MTMPATPIAPGTAAVLGQRDAGDRRPRAGAGPVRRAASRNRSARPVTAVTSSAPLEPKTWSSFTTARDLDPHSPRHDVAAALSALPPDAYPLTVDVAGELGDYGSDEHYDFVLDGLVAGFRAAAR